ncbi:hypothetical protein KBZ15_09255 [Cyanobium sp. BA20m-p-22]|nr:hypothetical protein [Cyanobium sp. BA20m-p-22]
MELHDSDSASAGFRQRLDVANLQAQADSVPAEIGSQVVGYLKTLEEKYEMVAKRLAVFAKPNARKGHPSTFAPGRARRTASAKGS